MHSFKINEFKQGNFKVAVDKCKNQNISSEIRVSKIKGGKNRTMEELHCKLPLPLNGSLNKI
ncbi:hypothetical protein D770_02525 [Flammeovirgaceae bacterium 311]|nr:hypothetical protein D770_02525 [Flammeovirgaceae bacterium 311]